MEYCKHKKQRLRNILQEALDLYYADIKQFEKLSVTEKKRKSRDIYHVEAEKLKGEVKQWEREMEEFKSSGGTDCNCEAEE